MRDWQTVGPDEDDKREGEEMFFEIESATEFHSGDASPLASLAEEINKFSHPSHEMRAVGRLELICNLCDDKEKKNMTRYDNS